jgi:hypothetical protein
VNSFAPRFATLALPVVLGLGSLACTEPRTPANGVESLPPAAAQWYDRAKKSLAAGDVDDARDAAQSAITAAPESPDVKVLAARVHLARLEYGEATRLLKGIETTEARGVRGRAHWYADELEAAADDLELVLSDPAAKDEWAKAISRLARRGTGRKPFAISGGMIAPLPMARFPRVTHMVIPVEIDGEQALAMVATGKGEVVLDSSTRKEPSWVSMRFGERIEVRDVPALVEDLSGISKELNAPIKALIGVNLLRRLNITFDWQGEQFIVRSKEPAPPPKATRVSLAYALGGAMVARVALKSDGPTLMPMLINTMLPFPIALDEVGWKAAGVELSSLQTVAGASVKSGRLGTVKLGAFDVPDVPGFYGPSFTEIQAATGMDVHGAVGSGLLAAFRCTLTDGGRAMWIEDLPQEIIDLLNQQMMQQAPRGTPPNGAPPPPAGSAPPAPPPPPAGAPKPGPAPAGGKP